MRYYFVLILFLFACTNSSVPAEEAQASTFKVPAEPLVDDVLINLLLGTWEAHSLSVTMPTHGNSDTTRFLNITPENWNEITGRMPVKTYFMADGQYYAEYYDLEGNLLSRPKGYWQVEGSTLMYDEREPQANRFFQEVRHLEKDLFQFSFNMDYDGDGEADDKAVGVSRKLK
ncbi:MAG: hypothetical protein AB8F95_08185 [Bacteroidia bacterium]